MKLNTCIAGGNENVSVTKSRDTKTRMLITNHVNTMLIIQYCTLEHHSISMPLLPYHSIIDHLTWYIPALHLNNHLNNALYG